jgi:hypothetical protein
MCICFLRHALFRSLNSCFIHCAYISPNLYRFSTIFSFKHLNLNSFHGIIYLKNKICPYVIAMAKGAFNNKRAHFTSKNVTGTEEETSKVLHLEYSFIWCWKLDVSGSISETAEKFRNVVLEKNGEDQLDRSCEKWRSVTYSQGAEEYPTWNK